MKRIQDKCWFFLSKYLFGYCILGVERNHLIFLKVLIFKNKNVIPYFYENKNLRDLIFSLIFNLLLKYIMHLKKNFHLVRLWINDLFIFFQKLNIPGTQQSDQKPVHYRTSEVPPHVPSCPDPPLRITSLLTSNNYNPCFDT